MNNVSQKLGIIPVLFLGGMLAISGIWLIFTIMNNTWLVPIDNANFNDFRRAVALDQIDPSALIDAADWRLIAFFLIAVIILMMGLSLPFTYSINRRLRLGHDDVPSLIVVGRQALWLGLLAAFCVWMQMNRSFWWPVAGLVAICIMLFEGLLVVRTRSAEAQQ